MASSYPVTPTARVVAANRPVNAGAVNPLDLSAQNSPTLLRSPVDERTLVVANRIDSPRFSCGLHVSVDGGRQWEDVPVPVPDGEMSCYAPDVAFGADGTLYVSFVTLKGLGNVPNGVWLSTLGPDMRPSTPTRVLGPLAFQTRLVADQQRPGHLLLTWLQAEATGLLALAGTQNPILTARSVDGGRTWTGPVQINGSDRTRVVAPSPVAGLGAQRFVLYLDLGDDRLDYAAGHGGEGGEPYGGRWQLVLARSDDAGSTWATSVVEAAVVPSERFIVFLPPVPTLAIDEQKGTLYASFADARLGDPDVWVWRSHDNGDTWLPPVRANDTPAGDGTSQYLAKLDVAAGGRLDLVYYDRRADPDDRANEVSYQASHDGGVSFTGRLPLSDRSFSSRVGFGVERNLPDLGSRLGLLTTPTGAMVVWTDTRNGTEETLKQDVMMAAAQVTAGRVLARPLRVSLPPGAVMALLAGCVLLVRAWRDTLCRRPRAESGPR